MTRVGVFSDPPGSRATAATQRGSNGQNSPAATPPSDTSRAATFCTFSLPAKRLSFLFHCARTSKTTTKSRTRSLGRRFLGVHKRLQELKTAQPPAAEQAAANCPVLIRLAGQTTALHTASKQARLALRGQLATDLLISCLSADKVALSIGPRSPRIGFRQLLSAGLGSFVCRCLARRTMPAVLRRFSAASSVFPVAIP